MSELIENTLVKLAQVAQMLKALAEKGWGRRELTLLGQATPTQLEDVRLLLQGRARLEPITKRWWKEGDEFIVPFPGEDRSGKELLVQDPIRFGDHLHASLRDYLPKVGRAKGEGDEYVIVPCPFNGATYEEVLNQLLASRPDLERAPLSAVLQLTAADVEEMGVQIVIGSDPLPDNPCPVVFYWYHCNEKVRLWNANIRTCGHNQTVWWQTTGSHRYFLLKRKA